MAMKTKTILIGLALLASPFLMKAQNCDTYFPYKKGLILEQQSFNAKNKLTGSVNQVVTNISMNHPEAFDAIVKQVK